MNTLVTLAVLFTCFAGLNALTCQSCSTIGSSLCGEPFDVTAANFSTTCSSSEDTCSKSTLSANGEISTVARACSTGAACTETCASLLGIEGCQYCCTTDDCNGASAVTFSLATIAATVLGAFAAHF